MNLTEEIASNSDDTGRQSQVVCSFDLGPSQHQSLEKSVHLLEGEQSFSFCTVFLDRFQKLSIEPAGMIHRFMTTLITRSSI